MSCEPYPTCAGAINALEPTWALVFVCSSAARGECSCQQPPLTPWGTHLLWPGARGAQRHLRGQGEHRGFTSGAMGQSPLPTS